jgi:hypothetical protein
MRKASEFGLGSDDEKPDGKTDGAALPAMETSTPAHATQKRCQRGQYPVSCKASRRTARHGLAAIASIGRTPACASTASRAHIGLDEN